MPVSRHLAQDWQLYGRPHESPVMWWGLHTLGQATSYKQPCNPSRTAEKETQETKWAAKSEKQKRSIYLCVVLKIRSANMLLINQMIDRLIDLDWLIDQFVCL